MKIKYHEQSKCPLCGEEYVEYGAFELDDEGGFYSATCTKCGAIWKECYNFHFDDNYDVCDKNGVEVKA